MFQIVVIETVT